MDYQMCSPWLLWLSAGSVGAALSDLASHSRDVAEKGVWRYVALSLLLMLTYFCPYNI